MTALDESRIVGQHAFHLKMVEDICVAVRNGNEKAQTLKMLNIFIKTISIHFENEEQVMSRKGYRFQNSHREDHKRLLGVFESALKFFCACELEFSGNIGEQLLAIIEKHAEAYDNPMMEYLDRIAS